MSGIKHTKVSTLSDGSNANQVQPSDWNADHEIDDPAVTRAALGLGSAATHAASDFAAAGGVLRPVFPTISNLQLRLSAEYSAITHAAGLVTGVSDLSGNGRDAINGSTNGKPRLFLRRFNNGWPCFWMSGTNDRHLQCTIPNIAAPCTVVTVCEELLLGTGGGNLYRDGLDRGVGYMNGGTDWSIFGTSSGITSSALYNQNHDRSPTNGPSGQPCVRIDVYNNASSLMSNNGVEVTGTVTCSGTIFGGTLHIGNDQTPAQSVKMLMYEFLVFDKALSPTERGLLNAYYRDAVGITI